jgi:hypothetical protein
VVAQGARDRARRAALPKTLADGRANVRAHQAQPWDGPLSPTRQVRRAHRMAPDHGHPQRPKAPQPHPGAHDGVNRGRRPLPSSNWPARRPPRAPGGFPRQPPFKASEGQDTTGRRRRAVKESDFNRRRAVSAAHCDRAPPGASSLARSSAAAVRRPTGPARPPAPRSEHPTRSRNDPRVARTRCPSEVSRQGDERVSPRPDSLYDPRKGIGV